MRTVARIARIAAWSAVAAATFAQEPAPIRVGLRARAGGADRLNPLRYVGGFETKTLVYETLVTRAPDGRLAPGLASSWQVGADQRSVRFELRPGARFHDGTEVTADAVVTHFRRWVGLPEHDWILANRRIQSVVADGDHAFTVLLDRPCSLLSDLVCINPCAIVGPGARDWEGEFVQPIGSGPFRFVGALDGGARWRLVRTADEQPLEIGFYPRGRDEQPLDALQQGALDVFVGGWDEDLPPARLQQFAQDPRFAVLRAPGSSVVYLSFRLTSGPTQDVAMRRRIAAAIDRAALVRAVEGGAADPCATWAAPAVTSWPKGPGIAAADDAAVAAGVALRIAAGRGEGRAARVARAVAAQLQQQGFAVEVLTLPASEPGDRTSPLMAESATARAAARQALVAQAETADLRVEITHGMPYDPHQSLVARFGPLQRQGEPAVRAGNTQELLDLVTEAAARTDESQCGELYARIQTLLDREALIVPLYAPHRTAVHTAAVRGIRLDPDVYRVDLTALRRVGR